LFTLQQSQFHQAGITKAKERRTQRAGQRQIVLRRHQHVEQRDDIEHFAAVDQIGFLTDLRRDVQRAQLVLQRQQASAFARQDHHV
jgi:hypothetical protein